MKTKLHMKYLPGMAVGGLIGLVIAGVMSLVQANQSGPFGGLAWILGGFIQPLAIGGVAGGLVGGGASSFYLRRADQGKTEKLSQTKGHQDCVVSHSVPNRRSRTNRGRVVTAVNIVDNQTALTIDHADRDNPRSKAI